MLSRLSSWRTLLALGLSLAVVIAALVANVTGHGRGPAAPQLQPTPIPVNYTYGSQVASSPGPDCGLCWYPNSKPGAAAPQSVANIIDTTVRRCDATGGHCARMHVVVQAQNAAQLRTFASVSCYSASGDFACAHVQGSAWLNCTTPSGGDCSTNGTVRSCTGNCAGFTMVSPWYSLPAFSQRYSGAASILFTTGATGGGSNWGLAGVTIEFGF